MNDVKESHMEDESSPFSRLPEDIVLQILSNLKDLKTLCLYKLVSKRFSLIVSQVEAISITFPTDPLVDPTNLRSDGSIIGSLLKFEKAKFVCIQLPSSFDDHILFKWKFIFEMTLDSFLFLAPNSVCHNKELDVNEFGHEEEEEDFELTRSKTDILKESLKDVMRRINLLIYTTRLPLLEKVSIKDSSNRGNICLSGGKVANLKNWVSSLSDEQNVITFSSCTRMSRCYIPFLRLPVSGYVMKGVSLYLVRWNDPADDTYDSLMKSDDDDAFEDKEEATYAEAMVEIFKKHRGKIVKLG